MTTLQSKHFVSTLPQLVKNPKRMLSDQHHLAEVIPLLSFLEPIGPLMVSPVIVDLESRKKKAKPDERKDQVFQEFVDQLTTTAVHFSAFLIGGYLAKSALPRLRPRIFKPDSSALENGQTVVSIFSTILGNTFIRPFIDTKVVTDKEQKKPAVVWAVPQNNALASNNPFK